jgi:hypothetical protein
MVVRSLSALALAVSLVATAAHADDCIGRAVAARSLYLCAQADAMIGQEREEILERALLLGEQAVVLREDHAPAHFAVFCALGKLLEQQGVGLRTVRSIGRARSELDRTLEIEPEYLDALVAKAEMLSRLPSWLGGDPDEAARCRFRASVLQQRGATLRVAQDYLGIDDES